MVQEAVVPTRRRCGLSQPGGGGVQCLWHLAWVDTSPGTSRPTVKRIWSNGSTPLKLRKTSLKPDQVSHAQETGGCFEQKRMQ